MDTGTLHVGQQGLLFPQLVFQARACVPQQWWVSLGGVQGDWAPFLHSTFVVAGDPFHVRGKSDLPSDEVREHPHLEGCKDRRIRLQCATKSKWLTFGIPLSTGVNVVRAIALPSHRGRRLWRHLFPVLWPGT